VFALLLLLTNHLNEINALAKNVPLNLDRFLGAILDLIGKGLRDNACLFRRSGLLCRWGHGLTILLVVSKLVPNCDESQ